MTEQFEPTPTNNQSPVIENDFETELADSASRVIGFGRQVDPPPDERKISEPEVAGALPEVHNTAIETSGYQLVIPDEKAIEQLAAKNPKIKLFLPPTFPSQEGMGKEGWYLDAVTTPAVDAAQAEFPDKTIAIRGVKGSINGTVVRGEGMSRQYQDIAYMADRGTNSPMPQFNVITHNPNDPDSSQHHMGSKYLFETEGHRATGTEEDQDPIFPTMLVYDNDMLARSGGEGRITHGVTMPEGTQPSDALLAVYVLPVTIW